jgi:hypothetical protein
LITDIGGLDDAAARVSRASRAYEILQTYPARVREIFNRAIQLHFYKRDVEPGQRTVHAATVVRTLDPDLVDCPEILIQKLLREFVHALLRRSPRPTPVIKEEHEEQREVPSPRFGSRDEQARSGGALSIDLDGPLPGSLGGDFYDFGL